MRSAITITLDLDDLVLLREMNKAGRGSISALIGQAVHGFLEDERERSRVDEEVRRSLEAARDKAHATSKEQRGSILDDFRKMKEEGLLTTNEPNGDKELS